MKRKDFFKRLGLIAGGVAIAPQLLIPKDKSDIIRGGIPDSVILNKKFTWSEETVQRISKISSMVLFTFNGVLAKVEKPDYYNENDIVEFIIDNDNRFGIVNYKVDNRIVIESIYNKFPENVIKAEYLRTIGSLQADNTNRGYLAEFNENVRTSGSMRN